MINFSQLANELNMSRAGARLLILRNETKLKKYLVYKDKKPIGIKDNSIEFIKPLVERKHNTIDKQKLQLDLLNSKIDSLEHLLIEKDNMLDYCKNEITRLQSEIDYYRSSWLKRLLTFGKH